MELNSEQEKFKRIIEALTLTGVYELNSYNFTNEDIKIRFEILKLICEVKDKRGFLQIKNIINIQPKNCIFQQRLFTFLQNLGEYTIEELITKFDSVSSSFYELKKDQRFLDYLKGKNFRAIPFFTMLGCFAFINLGADISKEIIKIIKKKYIKDIIEKYISIMRKSLSNILLYYYKIFLNSLDDEENNIDYNPNPNDLLYTELKASFEKYICFNETYDEGEIVNFVNCLYKTITKDIKSIYLKEGPEISNINHLIKYIVEEIIVNFSSKYYYEKSNLNELYDLIFYSINTLAEDTSEENYSKFIIKYCQYHKQGNKNVVISFFSGLNPDNFKQTFDNLNIDENNKSNYYSNIDSYINQISPKKKKKKSKKVLIIQNNNQNDNREEIEENKINDLNELNNDNSQNNNNNTNNLIINVENNNEQNKLLDANYSQEVKEEKNEETNIKIEKMEKKIEYLLSINQKMNKEIDNLVGKCDSFNRENKKIKEENKNMREAFQKFKEREINEHTKIKTELYKLKKEMRRINYRDISKFVINNYIEKYSNKLKGEKHLKNKKDKAIKIGAYLNGIESTYYNKIIKKYYDSNYNSHISKIFSEFGKNSIIGLDFDKNDIIDKIFFDYCKTILEEKVDNINNTLVEKLFGIKEIINYLYNAQYMD